jgi:hypothetical protein
MGFYIPSIYTVVSAFIVVGAIFLSRVSLFTVAVVSVLVLGLSLFQHYLLFVGEYRSMTMVDALIPFVPYIMVGAIVFFSTLYILFLQGPSAANTSGSTSSGWFGSLTNSRATPNARRVSPNYSQDLTTNSRNSGSSTNSLERQYRSALDRGI